MMFISSGSQGEESFTINMKDLQTLCTVLTTVSAILRDIGGENMADQIDRALSLIPPPSRYPSDNQP